MKSTSFNPDTGLAPLPFDSRYGIFDGKVSGALAPEALAAPGADLLALYRLLLARRTARQLDAR